MTWSTPHACTAKEGMACHEPKPRQSSQKHTPRHKTGGTRPVRKHNGMAKYAVAASSMPRITETLKSVNQLTFVLFKRHRLRASSELIILMTTPIPTNDKAPHRPQFGLNRLSNITFSPSSLLQRPYHTARFAPQNEPFRFAKRAVSPHDMACFGF